MPLNNCFRVTVHDDYIVLVFCKNPLACLFVFFCAKKSKIRNTLSIVAFVYAFFFFLTTFNHDSWTNLGISGFTMQAFGDLCCRTQTASIFHQQRPPVSIS